MTTSANPGRALALTLAAAGNHVTHQLDAALGGILGISWTEYRLLGALADAPHGRASRVDLAQSVSVTPSGVTRALRPLEKRRLVATQRSERDARLALAILTPAGQGLVHDATKVVDDVMKTLLGRAPRITEQQALLVDLLETLSRA